jgi:DNA invertase Pin-like site-specific DNA recombinase
MKTRKHRSVSRSSPPESTRAGLPDTGARVGYARVSTEDQNLELQTAALKEFGCHVIFTEKASAAARYRPELERALRTLRPGDVLAVWKLDRLARSLFDLKKRLEYIEACGASLKSLTQAEIDTSNTTGRLLINILGTVAEFERDIIRDRTVAGIKAARERGVKFGASPMLTPAERKQMAKDRRAGMTLRELARKYRCSVGTVQNWTVPRRKRQRT